MGTKKDTNVFKMCFLERKVSGERKKLIILGKKKGGEAAQGRAALEEIGEAVGGLGTKAIDGLGNAAHDVVGRVGAMQHEGVDVVKEGLARVQVGSSEQVFVLLRRRFDACDVTLVRCHVRHPAVKCPRRGRLLHISRCL